MSTPERKSETARNFAQQLDAAGPVTAIDGTDVGPMPAASLGLTLHEDTP